MKFDEVPTETKMHSFLRHGVDTLRGNSGATLLSYISYRILYTSIISPRNLLYFKVCKFKCNKRSLYGNFLSDITKFVALC